MRQISTRKKNELIKVKLAEILMKESGNDKFEGVTITNVTVSHDTAVAKVYYAAYNTKEEINDLTDALNQASGFFQKRLSNSLKIRHTPRLLFIYDKGFDHSDRISHLLNSL